MKKAFLFFVISNFLFFLSLKAQENPNIAPYSQSHELYEKVPTIQMPETDFSKDIKDAEAFEKLGNYPRFARHFEVNASMLNAGVWTELNNGDHLWRLNLKSKGALATSLFFDNFFIPKGATLHVYTSNHKQCSGSYTYSDNQGDGLFSTSFLSGEEQTIEYFEPAQVRGQGTLRISALAHQYRSLMAQDCEVNIICSPEGDNWQNEKKGVVRVYVVEGSQAGWCSGALMNNTNLDCERYILTAFHCGVSASTANFNQWKFYFNFEATTCGGGDGGLQTNVLTGCTKIASSNDNGGATGSDFLLLKMTSTASPAWWPNVYFNGWTNAAVAPAAGSICIHHPNGDNKKISQTTGNSISTTWGSVPNTHWRVNWGGTTNGWGVTEGGSSGAPLYNANGYVLGTLTGGGSFCNSVVPGGQNQPDSYGKMSYHWASNGSTNATKLQPWLDPTNSGIVALAGAYSPCTITSPPAPAFLGSTDTACINTPITFNDLSQNFPTTWSWSFPGGNPSTSTSQNPVVSYASAGTYNVTLTVSNAYGIDSIVQVNAITINQPPATPNAGNNSPVCSGASNIISFNTDTIAGATYLWTGPGSFSSTAQNPTRPATSVNFAGNYILTISVGGCTSAPDTTVVVINPTPTTPVITANTPLCLGNTLNMSVPVVAGATYSWTGPDSFTSTLQNPSIAGVTYAMAGTYSAVTTSGAGCVSGTGTKNVVVGTPIPMPTITINGAVLTSSATTGNQWYLNGVLIFGATGQNYTFTQNGIYTVRVTAGGCSSPFSADFEVTTAGIEEFLAGNTLMIYPNPNKGEFNISFNTQTKKNYQLFVYNSIGQIVYQKAIIAVYGKYMQSIDLKNCSKGIYLLSLSDDKGNAVKKVLVE
jgi:PKD repeat protein